MALFGDSWIRDAGWAVAVAAGPLSVLVYRWFDRSRLSAESARMDARNNRDKAFDELQQVVESQQKEIAAVREEMASVREELARVSERERVCEAAKASLIEQVKWMTKILKRAGLWSDDADTPPPLPRTDAIPQPPK